MADTNMATPILFTIPNFITAGSGRAMLNVVERLDRNLYSPAICVSRLGGDLCREVERQGIKLLEAPFTVPALPYSSLPLRAWRCAKFFRPYRFTAWHSFHYSDDYTEPLIARLAGAQAWFYTKKNMGWNRRWYLRTLFATRVAAQNTTIISRFFQGNLLRGKANLIPPGVNVDEFRPSEAARLRVRERFNIPAGAVLAGSVGHLVPVKGHGTLIRAAASLPGVYVLIAGKPLDQEYTASLEQLRRELKVEDRVHLTGNIADVPAFLAEIDIFVLPTWAKWRMEGCPVALLEAMACGKPCIATAIPGAQDVIEPMTSGLLVPPEDPVALAAALRKLSEAEALRRSIGIAARGRIVDAYTVDREVAQYDHLYRVAFGLA